MLLTEFAANMARPHRMAAEGERELRPSMKSTMVLMMIGLSSMQLSLISLSTPVLQK